MISRRDFVSGLTAAGTAGLLGLGSGPVAAEPPPETTKLRLVRIGAICQASQYVAEEFFRDEGFTDVQYIKKEGPLGIQKALASGVADINMHFVGPLVVQVEAAEPVVILAGGHVGCFELFGTDPGPGGP